MLISTPLPCLPLGKRSQCCRPGLDAQIGLYRLAHLLGGGEAGLERAHRIAGLEHSVVDAAAQIVGDTVIADCTDDDR